MSLFLVVDFIFVSLTLICNVTVIFAFRIATLLLVIKTLSECDLISHHGSIFRKCIFVSQISFYLTVDTFYHSMWHCFSFSSRFNLSLSANLYFTIVMLFLIFPFLYHDWDFLSHNCDLLSHRVAISECDFIFYKWYWIIICFVSHICFLWELFSQFDFIFHNCYFVTHISCLW